MRAFAPWLCAMALAFLLGATSNDCGTTDTQRVQAVMGPDAVCSAATSSVRCIRAGVRFECVVSEDGQYRVACALVATTPTEAR